MPGYTIKNLKSDIEDMGAKQMGGQIEARFGRSGIESEHLGVSYFRYEPNFKTPFGHRHGEQEEVYVVLSGAGRMKLDEEVVDLAQWDMVRVAPEVIRGIEGGPEGIELIAVGSDRPGDGDGEMIKDWWT